MARIVASGGLSLHSKKTFGYQGLIARIIGDNWREPPKRVLYVPTASYDNPQGIASALSTFRIMGCIVRVLTLEQLNLGKALVDWADIVYVGGGDTRFMMREWAKSGFDEVLKEAYATSRKTFAGASAGSICWFEGGLSDSERYSGNKNWKPIWVKGLGLIKSLHSPHYDSEMWRCEEMPQSIPANKIAIAIEDNCAIEVIGDKYRIIGDNMAFKCFYRDGRYVEEALRPHSQFRNLSYII